MTKNQRIENLERVTRTLADLLGYRVSANGMYVENSKYTPTLGEYLNVIYDELGITYIGLNTCQRKVEVFKKLPTRATKEVKK